MKDYSKEIAAEYEAAIKGATERVRCTRTMAIEKAMDTIKEAIATAKPYQLGCTFGGYNGGCEWYRSYDLTPKEMYELAYKVLNNLPIINIIWQMLDNNDWHLIEEVRGKECWEG